jgi:2-dehydropantoate 2-reductase
MRILVVGAGAVGQVYGWHLHQGGAEIGFLVKPGRRPDGFRLERLPKRAIATWDSFTVHDHPAAIGVWDAVVLTVASDALAASWLEPLGRATGSATVAVLQPGIKDMDRVAQSIDRARLVQGLIGIIAFRTPLEGDPRFVDEGVAYWFPPFVRTLLAGDRAKPLIEAFRRGGLPIARNDGIAAISGFGAAVLESHMAALELEGWSFTAARSGRWMAVASRASRQLADVAARIVGRRPPAVVSLVSPTASAFLAPVARAVMPFDVEAYLRAHFTKVGPQTIAYFESALREADGLPMDAVEELVAGLRAIRARANYTAPERTP